jgi:signal transduction histidine kinase
VNVSHKSKEPDPRLTDICNASQQLIRALDETVWTVNPSNDSLADLLDYITHFAEEFFRETKIRCQLKIPVDIHNCPMSTELRHGLLAIVKESLNNVLKHSNASVVIIRAQLVSECLQLTVQDNGRGFSNSPLKKSLS